MILFKKGNLQAVNIKSYGKEIWEQEACALPLSCQFRRWRMILELFPVWDSLQHWRFSSQRRGPVIRNCPAYSLQQTEATLVPISAEKPHFQHCCFPHIHFITQPHFGRFQMAPGEHSRATLICFIYLGTKCVRVCMCGGEGPNCLKLCHSSVALSAAN